MSEITKYILAGVHSFDMSASGFKHCIYIMLKKNYSLLKFLPAITGSAESTCLSPYQVCFKLKDDSYHLL